MATAVAPAVNQPPARSGARNPGNYPAFAGCAAPQSVVAWRHASRWDVGMGPGSALRKGGGVESRHCPSMRPNWNPKEWQDARLPDRRWKPRTTEQRIVPT